MTRPVPGSITGPTDRADRRLASATIPELVGALGGCPRCLGAGWPASRRTPAVDAIDELTWRCAWCSTAGTVYELRRLVAEDPVALVRLLDRVRP